MCCGDGLLVVVMLGMMLMLMMTMMTMVKSSSMTALYHSLSIHPSVDLVGKGAAAAAADAGGGVDSRVERRPE